VTETNKAVPMFPSKEMAGLFFAVLVGASASLEERQRTDACPEATTGASFVQMEAHRGRGQGFEEDETGTVTSELASLRKSMAEMFTQMTSLRKEVTELREEKANLGKSVIHLHDEVTELRKSSPFTVSGSTVKLENKDLHIRTGNLKVDAASGFKKGNIVIGNNDVTNARHSFAAGYMNVADGKGLFVLGESNQARGEKSVVLGGKRNRAEGVRSVVVGGDTNAATHMESVVVGGGGRHSSHQEEVVLAQMEGIREVA